MTHKVLLVGCGNIAGRFDMARSADASPLTHAGAFLRQGAFDLVACVDPDVQARNSFAQYWGITREADCISALNALPGEFDVISLCSPTALHHEHLAAAVKLQPRLILCEKPLTHSVELSAQWVRACAEQGICLVVNYTRQWDPSVDKLVNEVLSGSWGSVRSAAGFYNKGVLNNGGHLVDLIQRILGPLKVLAATAPVYDHWDCDPTVAGLLVSVGGCVPVSLNPAHAKDYALFELELICEFGVIRMCNGGLHWVQRLTEPSPHFEGYRALASSESLEGKYMQAMSLVANDIDNFLSHGHPPRGTGQSALAVQTICNDLLAAATHVAPSKN